MKLVPPNRLLSAVRAVHRTDGLDAQHQGGDFLDGGDGNAPFFGGKERSRKWSRTLSLVIGLSAAVFNTGGCASNEIKWTEEVRLHDGKVVEVKRRIELSGVSYPPQYRGSAMYHELCYAPLGVYWKSNGDYRPSTFDIIGGKAYVKVYLRGCINCMLHNSPSWDALYFEWDSGAWKRVDENATLARLRFNLLSGSYHLDDGSRDARGLINLAEKEGRDGEIYRRMKITGQTGPYESGMCKACGTGRPNTSRDSEVFILSENKTCNW